jgi:hypothetical protein
MAAVTFTIGNLPANYCWSGAQQFAIDFGTILSGTVPDSGIIISSAPPGPANQSALWARIVSGYLEGIYQYNGGWFRPHPIPASSSVRQIWFNTEASVWAFDGGDGTNPTITPPTSTTGAMWQVDHSMDFKMVIGAGTNTVPYDGNPANSIAQGASVTSSGAAGEERHILISSELAPHVHLQHQGLVGHAPADNAVFKASTTDGQPDANTVSGGGNPASGTPPVTALSHQNLPPFLGGFFIQRTARALIQGT